MIHPALKTLALTLAATLAACAPANGPVTAGPDTARQTPFTAPAAAPADIAALTAAGNRFSAELYLREAQAPGNVILSPVSISSAFALLQPGARGETAAELAAILGFDAVAPEVFADTMGALMADLETHVAPMPAPAKAPEEGSEAYWALKRDPAADFSIANAAWVKQGYKLQAAYQETLARAFGAEPNAIDFSSPDAAAATINAWVASKTNDRIKDLISPDIIDPMDTRLILTNAVWFKAKWKDAFEPDATQDGDFFGRSGAAMPARLMRRMGTMPYIKGDGFGAIRLDYTHPDFTLAVILPDAKDAMPGLEARLGAQGLTDAIAAVQTAPDRDVYLTLPKATVDGRFDLVPSLQALGATRVFDPGLSDLSGLIENKERLYVSDVVHVTWFQMDETTTEAAAATAIAVATESAMLPPEPPVEFRVDHPFLISLIHKPTGAILFLGRIEAVTPP